MRLVLNSLYGLMIVNKQKRSRCLHNADIGSEYCKNLLNYDLLFSFGEILHVGAAAVLEEHRLMIPVEWLEIVVVDYLIVAHHESVHAFGIHKRRIECLKDVVADDDGVFRATVEIGFRFLDIGYFGIN